MSNEKKVSHKVVMLFCFFFQCWDLHQEVQRKRSTFHILKISWKYQGEYWLTGGDCQQIRFSQ